MGKIPNILLSLLLSPLLCGGSEAATSATSATSATPALATLLPAPPPPPFSTERAMTAARLYRDLICKHETATDEAIQGACRAGDHLVREAGGWQAGLRAMKNAWREQGIPGNPGKPGVHHSDGCYDPEVRRVIDADTLEYIQYLRENGAPTRTETKGGRVRSRPHASYLGHLKEGREKAWKEMRKGRVLSITSKLSPELLEGIKSSPMVRAAKLEPDRSVSCDGRFCHDQRKVLNEAGVK